VTRSRGSARRLRGWWQPADHPVVVRTCHSASGCLSFEAASPHLTGDLRDQFLGALRRDVSLCTLERARPVFRQVPTDGPTLAPETCTPYVAANALGYYVKTVLPLVFVRTRRGELLPEARVAVKYMRENARDFGAALDALAAAAAAIFDPAAYKALRRKHPYLVADVAQPYAAFSNAHIAMRAGCYVKTPPGMATLLGPPINQRPPLPVHTGLMESAWHHSELFMVYDCPAFDGRILLLPAGTVVAQFYFVAHEAHESSEVRFSRKDLGADPAYRQRSVEVGLEVIEQGRDFLISETRGVMSLDVGCPHCWTSVTAAAEGGVDPSHVQRHEFYPGYKALRAEYRRLARRNVPAQVAAMELGTAGHGSPRRSSG
jgi:hypothetical protein